MDARDRSGSARDRGEPGHPVDRVRQPPRRPRMSEKEKLERGPAHPAFLKPAGPNLGVAPPRGEAPPRRGMFASLAHRPFRRYWIGLFLSNIGTWMQVVAQGWLVLRLSDSALMLGLVGFAGSIPTLLLAPLAGVAADRVDRRRLLMSMQSVQMVCALILAAATGFHFVSVPLVAAVAIVNGLANAFTMPSHQSLFLDLVGREDLMNAISLNSMQFNLSRVIGPMIAGLTIAGFGETGCFLLNAISYLAVISALAALPALHRRRAGSRGAWVDLRIGMRFARRRAIILPLLAVAASLSVFGTPAVTLAPLFARRLLHVGPQGLGGMLSAVGLGAAASALFLASLGLVPVGNLQAGAVAERFGAAAALYVGAAGIAVTLLTVWIAKPFPAERSGL